MDEPPSGLPLEAFASSPQHQQHLSFPRFHPPPSSSVRGVRRQQQPLPPQHQHQHQQHQAVAAAPPTHPPPPTPATPHTPFTAHLDPNLQPLDPNDAFAPSFDASTLSDLHYGGDNYTIPQQLYSQPAPSPTTPISHHPQQQQHHHQHHHHQQTQQHLHRHPLHHHPQHDPRTPQSLASHPGTPRNEEQVKSGGQLGILVPHKQLDSPLYIPNGAVARLHQEHALEDARSGGGSGGDRGVVPATAAARGGGGGSGGDSETAGRVGNVGPTGIQEGSPKGGPKQGGHFPGMRSIPDPPNLEGWRQVLFSVDRAIELTEEEFQTYFPHVDNVYSHRSTQRYKKQPFVSHYWDCRLKGRPPGTPKSEDPTKRKRKRQARERDLCDVKIKITEYFANARTILGNHPAGPGPDGQTPGAEPMQAAGLVDASRPVPGADGQRYYQIQRVNGNGGNGKADGVAGPHKHDLRTSDEIKKNSIKRALAKDEKEKKKAERTVLRKATGLALATVKKHSKDDGLKLYGCCFCPFTQRVWITLELKGISYQYIEVDPTAKPPELFERNAGGVFPALRHNGWSCTDSATLIEYIDELHPTPHPLLPADPQARALCRVVGALIRQELVPAYYHLLEAQGATMQAERGQLLQNALRSILITADGTGPFFLGSHFSYVDVMIAPWIIRMKRVLRLYRAWQEPAQGTRWHSWIQHVEAMDAVKKTTSSDDLYKESFERFPHELDANRAMMGTAGLDTFLEGVGLP